MHAASRLFHPPGPEELRLMQQMGRWAEAAATRADSKARQEGLTATYNRFHNPDESATDIARLRELHVAMDQAVAAAYGWDDLSLGHGFHETDQGLRFTIDEPARREILGRLLALNHRRYAEEVAMGLHEKGGSTKSRSGAKAQSAKGAKGAKAAAGDGGQLSLL